MNVGGNLVVRSPKGKVVWSSRTAGHPYSYAKVSDNGLAVESLRADLPLWERYLPTCS